MKLFKDKKILVWLLMVGSLGSVVALSMNVFKAKAHIIAPKATTSINSNFEILEYEDLNVSGGIYVVQQVNAFYKDNEILFEGLQLNPLYPINVLVLRVHIKNVGDLPVNPKIFAKLSSNYNFASNITLVIAYEGKCSYNDVGKLLSNIYNRQIELSLKNEK